MKRRSRQSKTYLNKLMCSRAGDPKKESRRQTDQGHLYWRSRLRDPWLDRQWENLGAGANLADAMPPKENERDDYPHTNQKIDTQHEGTKQDKGGKANTKTAMQYVRICRRIKERGEEKRPGGGPPPSRAGEM